MPRALIIDDDKNYVSALSTVVKNKGFTVDIVDRYKPAMVEVNKKKHDLVFVDMVLPDGNGIDIIKNAPEDFDGKFFVMTGYPSVDSAVTAMSASAVDYLVKPVTTRKIDDVLNQFLKERLSAEPAPRKQTSSSTALPAEPTSDAIQTNTMEIVGESAPVRKMLHDINRLAATAVTVLIQGESGTGKELVANKIHALSDRKGPLHAISCGSLSSDRGASELFGHEKGSFPGAEKGRKGLFERARGGTLFLDEITEMPLDMQVNLLRVLESGEFSRAGSSEPTSMDVRVIASTNSDPIDAIREGKLREDLYFRLAEMPIIVPPLRNRGKDILILSDYFLGLLNAQHQENKVIDNVARVALMKYSWPGNVRELSHAIHRAYIVGDRVLDLSEIPDMADDGDASDSQGRYLGSTIANMEKDLILRTLAHFDNDKPHTAEVLGISLKTLYNRLNRYNRPQHNKIGRPS